MGSSSDEQLNAALDLMRRLPPSNIQYNLSGLVNLLPEIEEDLLQRIDQPLSTAKDEETGRPFILCDYNRDGDSYRSPFSNKYFPPCEEGFMIPERLRELEVRCNSVFDTYRQLYYEGGISSVYLWDQEETGGFAGVFLIKKEVDEPQRHVSCGSWDSMHVIEAIPKDASNADLGQGTFTYRLTTTVMLSMKTDKDNSGSVDLSGSLFRQGKDRTVDIKSDADHVIQLGEMIEDMEQQLRNQLDGLYIQKTREVVNSIRSPIRFEDQPSHALVSDLAGALKNLKSGARAT